MKSALLTIAIATAFFAPAASRAAEKSIKRTALFQQLDKNGNFKIDGKETAELRAIFAKVDATSPIKKIDSNKNGKLEDGEVAAFSAKYSAKSKKEIASR
jgi:hypothetical protein